MTVPQVVANLVSARRLEAVPDDLPSAQTRLERAVEKLDAAKAIVEIDVEIAYVSAYDATRIAITAHMLAAGYRARPIARAHEAVGDYAEAMIATPSVTAFHAFRRRRNKAEYDDAIVSRADFNADLAHAQAIIDAVARDLASRTAPETTQPSEQDQRRPQLDRASGSLGTRTAQRPPMRAVLAAFGLRGKIISTRQVGRAWSNRVFHVRTSEGEYAIKQLLNPWQEPDWLGWLREAAAFELYAADAGIAMPKPITSPDGMIFVEVESGTFRAHDWAIGEPCPDGPVDENTARTVGAQLARIHALHYFPNRTDVFPTMTRDNIDGWDELILRVADHDQDLARQAAAASGAVRRIGRLLDRSITDFSDQPMSHGDVDQKNLILTATGPVLCDWDVSGPWPPRQELARTALSLAVWQVPAIARAVIAGYRDGGGEAYEIVPEDLGVDVSVGLDWTVLCLERATGLRDDGEQRRQEAAESVSDQLAGLPTRLDLIENIEHWLRS